MKMNYENVAKMVYELVKNPERMLSLEHGLLPSAELKTSELKSIQTVFSKYEVSGDTMAVIMGPLSLWD